MEILHYIGKRLLMLIPVTLGITILAFALAVNTPGDPLDYILNPETAQFMTQEEQDAIRERYGLNDPAPVQYIKWFGRVLKGDLGRSIISNKSIREEMGNRIPNTVRLAVSGSLMTIVFGIGFGVLMAVFRNTWTDRILRISAVIMLSVPGFWLAIILIFVFAEQLRWLPTSGYDGIHSLILPSVVVSFSAIGVCARLTRGAVLDELGKQYTLVANAKGLPYKLVTLRHAFRNSLVPIVTFLGNFIAGILGGSVVAETIFSLNGIGSYAVRAVQSRDYFVVQAYVLFTGVVYVCASILIDLIYLLINPKIRLGET